MVRVEAVVKVLASTSRVPSEVISAKRPVELASKERILYPVISVPPLFGAAQVIETVVLVDPVRVGG